MKIIKTTLLLTCLIILGGCEIDYGNTSINSVGEIVEVVPSKAEANQDVAHIHKFSELEIATVVNIVDGYTVDLKFERSENESENVKKIRLISVNESEVKNTQPYAIEATNFTEMLLLGKDVLVEYDVEKTDRYGRNLAYLWLAEANYEYEGVQYQEKGVMINDLLLKHGLAHVAVYKPNELYKEHFYAIEKRAKQKRVGMWE